jgi:glycosyltransferase involved in cell wall biosynthesis
MRVLYLINSFNYGGAENHVLDLANSMAELGNDVHVIAGKGLQANRLSSKVKYIPMRMRDIFLPFQVVLICFIASRYRIEIMHAHKRLAILQASLAGTILNVPVVATVHGRPRYDMRSRLSKRLTDRIIFVNNTTYQANFNSRYFRDKSVLIHNGVKINGHCAVKNHFTLLYICRIDRKHAEMISMLINDVVPEIIKRYPEVTFEIAGDGEFFGILKNDAEILNRQFNRKVILFHGFIDDIKPVVDRSGIVMGVGRVALEALSCSVPVISLNRKFMGQLITRDNYEFYRLNNFVAIDHGKPDTEKLAGMLSDYLHDPEFWHSEAKELRRSVEEHLSIEKIVSDIHGLYTEACLSKKD